MTQLELANSIGTTVRSVRRWEKEEAVPDIFIAVRMAKMFGVKVDQIFFDDI